MNLDHVMLSERCQTQKVTYQMISFTQTSRIKQIQRDRKQMSSCQGLRRTEWGVTVNTGCEVSFWSDENFLELDSVDSFTTLLMY